tara:strand:+ start:293 stop:910 length:618 start_codon:yes stop_codon:yes gene_type:complete
MKKDLWILAITAIIVGNMYFDNLLVKKFMQWKKYYRMVGVTIFGILLFLFCRRNPKESTALLQNANELIRLMPIDRNTTSLLQPILQYNRMGHMGRVDGSRVSHSHTTGMGMGTATATPYSHLVGGEAMKPTSAVPKTKRSVSETKKKYVASRQNWTCKECGSMLTAWFEIDHITRLEYGGSNDASNLVALCRNCHGKKTAMENM